MTKYEYANEVAKLVNGEVKEIEKANGIVLLGICKRDTNITPTVYIDKAFEEGRTVEETAAEVLRIYETETPDLGDVNDILDYSKVKPLLKARLYNAATKTDVFKSVAEYGFDDLIIVPYVQLTEEASTKVNTQLLNIWNVSVDEVIATAIENAKNDIVETSIAEMLGMPDLYPTLMRVITSKTRMYGAIGVIYKLKELKERYEKFIVIPSSIHDVIVIPEIPETEDNFFTEMIKAVNEEQVAPEERLSNHEYYFTR